MSRACKTWDLLVHRCSTKCQLNRSPEISALTQVRVHLSESCFRISTVGCKTVIMVKFHRQKRAQPSLSLSIGQHDEFMQPIICAQVKFQQKFLLKWLLLAVKIQQTTVYATIPLVKQQKSDKNNYIFFLKIFLLPNFILYSFFNYF